MILDKVTLSIVFDDGTVVTREFVGSSDLITAKLRLNHFMCGTNPIGIDDHTYYPRHRVKAYKHV